MGGSSFGCGLVDTSGDVLCHDYFRDREDGQLGTVRYDCIIAVHAPHRAYSDRLGDRVFHSRQEMWEWLYCCFMMAPMKVILMSRL